MRTRSRSRHKIAEPLRIEFHSQEDQFQEDPPKVSMADNRTMAQLLKAPTVGYGDAIVIPETATTNFELKHVLRNIQSQGQSTQNQCQNIQNQYQMVQNQLANLTDMMSKFMSFNMASSSRSGTLPGNTVTNLKEDLKGITTQSGVTYNGPTIPTPFKVVK
nr:hypothetical protein [Tanacetum cinerariifolium]